MKRFIIFCLVATFCMSLALVVNANEANPFKNRYEGEAYQEKQAGVAKNVFVVYDENGSRRNDIFTVFYMDNSQQPKQAVSSRGKAYVNFTGANYIQVTLLQIGEVDYQIVGDAFENIDAEDVREGEVNYYVLSINRSEKKAYIYDAD